MSKKNNKAMINTLDDTRNIVHDFQLRFPFESYRTTEYKIYPKLEETEIMPKLEEHMDKLFAGEVDDGNGDMLDNIIFSPAREAKPYLSKQHVDHGDMIRRLIVRRKADIEDFRNIVITLKNELADLQEEHKKTCTMIESTN